MAELNEKEKAQLFDKMTNNIVTKSNQPVIDLSKIEPKKVSGIAKFLTLAVLLITLGFGIFGSFKVAGFEMDSYVKFLDKFIWPTSTLILSIGAGAVTKKIVNGNKKEDSTS